MDPNRKPETSEQVWQLGIAGMTCASCVARVEKALKKVPGVEEASVNLATESARVRSAAALTREMISAAVQNAGYEPVWPSDAPDDAEAGKAQVPDLERRHLLMAVALSTPLVLPMFALLFGAHWMLPGGCSWCWRRRCSSGWARASTAPAGVR